MIPADEDDSARRRVRESDLDDLVEHLDSGDQRVRNSASVSLARHAEADPDRTMEYLPALASRLDQRDAVVRGQVSAAIAQLAEGDPNALVDHVPALVDCLDDDSLLVRGNVLEALFEVARADPEAVEPATERLVAQFELVAAFVRTRAVHVLVHVARDAPTAVDAHVPEMVSHLLDHREEPELERSGENVSPSLPAHESRRDPYQQVIEGERVRWASIREGIALILATMAPHRPERYRPHVSELASLVTDDTMLVRKSAVEILGCIAEVDARGVRPTVPELVDRLRGDDADIVRARAAWALAQLSVEDETALEGVIADLSPIAELIQSDDVEVRTAAATVLASVAETHPERVASVRPVVLQLFDDDSVAVRRQSALALASLGDAESQRRLVALRAADPDPEVRTLAAELVQSLRADGELHE